MSRIASGEGAVLFLVRTVGFCLDSYLAVTPRYQCPKEQNSLRETPESVIPQNVPMLCLQVLSTACET